AECAVTAAAPDDDEIEASRAPLMDHLMELRDRLVRSIAAVVVGFIVCFIFVDPLFMFLAQPFQTAMAVAHPERAGEASELINTGACGYFWAYMQHRRYYIILHESPRAVWLVVAFNVQATNYRVR